MSGETTGRQQKKAESRRRILESAREIFFRDGFAEQLAARQASQPVRACGYLGKR